MPVFSDKQWSFMLSIRGPEIFASLKTPLNRPSPYPISPYWLPKTCHAKCAQRAARIASLTPEKAISFFPIRPVSKGKKRYVLHVLQLTGGNVSATARFLNVDRRSLYRMLARYKIEPFLKTTEAKLQSVRNAAPTSIFNLVFFLVFRCD